MIGCTTYTNVHALSRCSEQRRTVGEELNANVGPRSWCFTASPNSSITTDAVVSAEGSASIAANITTACTGSAVIASSLLPPEGAAFFVWGRFVGSRCCPSPSWYYYYQTDWVAFSQWPAVAASRVLYWLTACCSIAESPCWLPPSSRVLFVFIVMVISISILISTK